MSWIIIYEVIHYLVEGGQNGNFHLRFRAKLQEGKNEFRKMAASQCYFYRDKCQWWPFKNGETAHFKFFLQSLHACNSKARFHKRVLA